LLFCIILGLPCFYTSVGVEKGLKINEILYFNLDNIDIGKAKKRLTNETTIVIDGYKDLIGLIGKMNEKTAVHVSGDTKTYNFTKEFYAGLINDLTQIIKDVENKSNSAKDTTDFKEVNNAIGAIQTMSVNNFIRKNGNGDFMLIRTANKYNSGPPINKFGESKYKSATFLFIGTEMNKQNTKSSGGKMLGGNKPDEPSFFEEEKVTTYIDVDPIESEKTDNSCCEFDAREELYSRIHMLLVDKAGDAKLFSDVLSELLHIFNYDPSYDDENIKGHIASILNEIERANRVNMAIMKTNQSATTRKIAWAEVPKSKSRKRSRSPNSLYPSYTSVSKLSINRQRLSRHGPRFGRTQSQSSLGSNRSKNPLKRSRSVTKLKKTRFNNTQRIYTYGQDDMMIV
jgi:hypothetical protein